MEKIMDVTNPSEIERISFEIIDSEVPEPRPFKGPEWQVVRRMIHTTADFELLSLVEFHKDAVSAGVSALKHGCTIVTDTGMARSGIARRFIRKWGCRLECFINDEKVIRRSKKEGITRAMAAVDLALDMAGHGIFVIGNAPTALLRLVDYIDKGICRPALVVGMPVGFVNAKESKEILASQSCVPYITVRGRKGGSALAASVVNAIANIAMSRE